MRKTFITYKKTKRGTRCANSPGLLKGLLRIVSLIALVSLIAPNVISFAEEQPKNTLKAGIFNFDGYHMMDENGELTGYGIDFLELVARYSHLNFELVGYDNSWNEMLEMLEDGGIDVLTSARKTDEREEKFAYSMPIGRNKTVLWIQVNDTEHLAGDYGTYDGMTVGELAGSSQNQSLKDFAAENGLDFKIVEYNDTAALAAALQSGEIDAILSSDLRKTQNEKTLEVISEDYFYAIVRKDDASLIEEINYAIEQINRNEGDWQNTLYYKYYGPVYSSEELFTKRERDYINSVKIGEKKITVTAKGNRKPYSYVEGGALKGILLDYFADIMNIAGLPYEVIVPKDDAEYYHLIETQAVDVVLDEINLEDESKSEGYGFNTDVYLTTSIARVGKQGAAGKTERIALTDTPSGKIISNMLEDSYEINMYPTPDDAVKAVMDGEVDAAYTYAYTVQLFVDNDTTNTLYYSVADNINMDFQMSVKKSSDHELFTILNKCVRDISPDTLNHIILEYTSHNAGNIDFLQYMRANPTTMLALAFSIAGALCVIVILILKARWNQRTLDMARLTNKAIQEQLDIVETLSRDYMQVFALNKERGTINVIKSEDGGFIGEMRYGEFLSDYIDRHVHPDDRYEVEKALNIDNVAAQISLNGEYAGNYRVIDNGATHNYQFTYVKMGKDFFGEEGFVLAGFRNVDEAVKKELQQKKELANALEKARAANKAKTTFLNNMSHDIRTPMNAIIGFTTIAEKHIDNKSQVKDCLNKVLISGKHLLNLINDILDMSRIESGKMRIHDRECNLAELTRNLIDLFEPQLNEKNLSLTVEITDVYDENVITDSLKLNQVLINLMSNSVKYTPAGGSVTFGLLQKPSTIKGYADYVFTIKDTGVGMSPEFLEHLFEPFERAVSATKSGIEGTGLGMSITKNIIEMLNGKISVQSQQGKGSEFKVELTLKLGEREDGQDSAQTLKDLKVLILSDDTVTFRKLEGMLRQIGINGEHRAELASASTVIETAAKEGEPFDICIIDVKNLSSRDYRTIDKIKSAGIDVILLTDQSFTDIESQNSGEHITVLRSKPLFLSDLKTALIEAKKGAVGTDGETYQDHNFAGKRILLVDDNELNREVGEVILSDAGFIVDMANDGVDAVEKVERSPKNYYDAVLMDIQMPVMNGHEATAKIRELNRQDVKKLPIIAMTANAMDEDKDAALDNNMDAYLSKPIDIEALIEILRKNVGMED